MLHDLPYIYIFWLVFLFIGVTNLPLTFLIFKNFIDRGYIFSKILGLAFISYLVFLTSSLKILPFTFTSIILAGLFMTLLNVIIFLRKKRGGVFHLTFAQIKLFFFEELLFITGLTFWSLVRGFAPEIHGLEKFMDFGFINSILRTPFLPPNDMWLAISPEYLHHTINYYYFGHFVTALLTKLSKITPEITYNLMLGLLFAFTFTGPFSIALNLFAFFQKKIKSGSLSAFGRNPLLSYNKRTLICALLAGFLVTLGGNLHTIYAFTKGYALDKPVPFWQVLGSPNTNAYWYPNATRFIPNTIHEFPIYSFVVSDLHGHVLDIPFVLLAIAFLFSILISAKTDPIQKLKTSKSYNTKHITYNNKSPFSVLHVACYMLHELFNLCVHSKFILLGFLLAVLYMTNAWDGIIYFGLSGLVLFIVNIDFKQRDIIHPVAQSATLPAGKAGLELRIKNFKISLNLLSLILNSCFLILTFIVFSLPFNRNFIPFAKGIGINCITPNSTGQVLCDHSPIWMLAILWGYFMYFAMSFILFTIIPGVKNYCSSPDVTSGSRTSKKYFSILPQFLQKQRGHSKKICLSDIFVTLLIIISTGLLIAPEFIFARDIYPAHYRANTMFKLGYQAFMMLGISVAYIFCRFLTVSPFTPLLKTTSFLKTIVIKLSRNLWWTLAFFQLFLVAIYPWFATNSYYNGLKTYQTLDGLNWLSKTYPGDYAAVKYFRENIPALEQPVILEAVGESYTDYARISANTGLPTVVGWPVHEWLWRGSYDEAGKRQEEVRKIYEGVDPNEVKTLLDKYQVRYIIVGSLEIEKYSNLNEQIFQNLGKLVFVEGATRIYKLN